MNPTNNPMTDSNNNNNTSSGADGDSSVGGSSVGGGLGAGGGDDRKGRMDIDTFEAVGWGQTKPVTMRRLSPKDHSALSEMAYPDGPLIARGLGRSYGDAAQLSGGHAINVRNCRRSHWIDRSKGILRVEAGVSLGELVDRYVPLGWFIPVTPGTRVVTIGGAIAADVHGKNHHIDGSFCDHITSMRLRLADNTIVEISPSQDAELFWATVGGMGLTGVILDCDLVMSPIPTSRVMVETSRHKNIDELVHKVTTTDHLYRFSVAWVDLLGGARSVLTQGNFAQIDEAGYNSEGRFAAPPVPTIGLGPIPIPRLAHTPFARIFNQAYYMKAPAEPTITSQAITPFFHPLDAVTDWNRVYGSTGFVQWQCAVEDTDVMKDLCERLGRLPAYLCVLKRFGKGNAAPLSFPTEGWTIAADLPATAQVFQDLIELDRIVADNGGRFYLAKDSRMSREIFEAGYDQLDQWKRVRDAADPKGRFKSDLSQRLGLTS